MGGPSQGRLVEPADGRAHVVFHCNNAFQQMLKVPERVKESDLSGEAERLLGRVRPGTLLPTVGNRLISGNKLSGCRQALACKPHWPAGPESRLSGQWECPLLTDMAHRGHHDESRTKEASFTI